MCTSCIEARAAEVRWLTAICLAAPGALEQRLGWLREELERRTGLTVSSPRAWGVASVRMLGGNLPPSLTRGTGIPLPSVNLTQGRYRLHGRPHPRHERSDGTPRWNGGKGGIRFHEFHGSAEGTAICRKVVRRRQGRQARAASSLSAFLSLLTELLKEQLLELLLPRCRRR